MSQPSGGLALFRRSHEALLERFLELERQGLEEGVVEARLMEYAEALIREHNTSALIAGTGQLDEEERKEFRNNVRGLLGGGSLVPLLDRDDVENIHILGPDTVILSLADGRRIHSPPLVSTDEELVMMIRHLAATAGHTSRRFDTASPILDLRLASGHRLFAVTSVAERTSVVIRRHRMLQASLDRLEQSRTVTPEMRTVLSAAVRPPNPANLLVVGGTGAGKTTLLRSLLSEVPQHELIVTIEDTLELHLRSSGLHERTLALETRTSNTEGTGEISMYDLCKAALRMSPDRVMVGEVRGGEVMQLLQAMGIGNDGSMGTIHAGSTRAAINKILIYAQRSPDAPTPDSVLREISEVLHLLVYIKKLPDGRRAITSIREVVGFEEGTVLTSEVFAPGPDGIGVYTNPFNPDGETLARMKASGFDPAVLGDPVEHTPDSAPATTSAPPAVEPPPAASPKPRSPWPAAQPAPSAPVFEPPAPRPPPIPSAPAATRPLAPASPGIPAAPAHPQSTPAARPQAQPAAAAARTAPNRPPQHQPTPPSAPQPYAPRSPSQPVAPHLHAQAHAAGAQPVSTQSNGNQHGAAAGARFAEFAAVRHAPTESMTADSRAVLNASAPRRSGRAPGSAEQTAVEPPVGQNEKLG